MSQAPSRLYNWSTRSFNLPDSNSDKYEGVSIDVDVLSVMKYRVEAKVASMLEGF